MQTQSERYNSAVARNFKSFMTRFQVSSLNPEQLKKFSEEDNIRHHIGISRARPVLTVEIADFASRAKARLAKLNPKDKKAEKSLADADKIVNDAITAAAIAIHEEGKKPFKKGASKKTQSSTKH